MARAIDIESDDSVRILDDEDDETLAAIDEGIRDAQAGRVSPIEEVRKLLPAWITASSSRKGRLVEVLHLRHGSRRPPKL
jgi:predicted transcriptional regulator